MDFQQDIVPTFRCNFVSYWLDKHKKYFAQFSHNPKPASFSEYVYTVHGKVPNQYHSEHLYYTENVPGTSTSPQLPPDRSYYIKKKQAQTAF